MTTLFAATLVLHVVLGLVGVIASFMTTYGLIKSEPKIPFIKKASITAFLAYVLSWLSAGYYYWFYYGANVKPVILEGSYPWAHLVFMEAKEHVFLFLPFATLALAVLIILAGDRLASDGALRKQSALLSLMITILAIIVTLSGVLITGGAR